MAQRSIQSTSQSRPASAGELLGGSQQLEELASAGDLGEGHLLDTPRKVPSGGGNPKKLYPDARGFEVLELPYKGGELSMVVILPRWQPYFPARRASVTPRYAFAFGSLPIEWASPCTATSVHPAPPLP
jgi:hypothetical protein